MNYSKSRVTFVLAIVVLLTIACGSFIRLPRFLARSDEKQQTDGDGKSSIANGERIYFSATNQNGERLPYRGGPNFGGMMMGSYMTCAACHGPEGRGGVHAMHMQVMDSPDIRYVALSGEEDDHSEGEGGAHNDKHGEYDLENFRAAVIDGKHPDGESLSIEMPRWQISDEDLADLFEFLKSLQ